MKKIITSIVALVLVGATLTGCAQDGTSSLATSEQDISGLSSETETFVTTTTEEIVTTTEEDTSLITADTREELAIGLLEAICADDEKTIKRYGYSSKAYTRMIDNLRKSKQNAGLSEDEVIATSDFEIYISDGWGMDMEIDYIHNPEASKYDNASVYIISSKLPSIVFVFRIDYDYDTQKYNLYSYDGIGEVADADKEYMGDFTNIYDQYSYGFSNGNILPLE